LNEKIWNNVDELHEQALKAVNYSLKNLVKEETVKKYYNNPKNKGWIGNSIESDWFGLANNSRKEADFSNLGVELKVTPIRKTKAGWSAKERLSLNIFDFNDEYKRDFKKASFLEKANLMELMYYEFIKDVPSPELVIKAATLFNLRELPEEDILIIEQDWKIIIDKIREGKAEELSDSLTKYLGATTKGSKSEKNMTTQPFSDKKAHRRCFTIKGSYMTMLARKIMSNEYENKNTDEKIIKDITELKKKTFEKIILDKFEPFIGQSKKELAKKFEVSIPKKNDKGSSALIAKKILNVEGNIQDTDEFKKAGIEVKIVTVESGRKRTTEAFKLQIPEHSYIEPTDLILEEWDNSLLNEYLSSYQFLLIMFENNDKETVFKGAKFWRVPHTDLEGDIKKTWEKVVSTYEKGVTLNYKKLKKATKTGKMYSVGNNLPKISDNSILHVRPSSKIACYTNDLRYATKLPIKSKWTNKPYNSDLSNFYMTQQAWWLNPDYMYEQVKEIFVK